MDADVYGTVKSCTDRPTIGANLRHWRKPELFPPSIPIEFVAIDTLGPLARTRYSSQFVVDTTDKYSKLTREILTTRITSTQVSNIFFNSWVILYSILDTVLSDNGEQFVSKMFHIHVYVSKSEEA